MFFDFLYNKNYIEKFFSFYLQYFTFITFLYQKGLYMALLCR
ncbi:hypothetical protein HMPREF1548_00134 [Clostridium sp. KLE 1755]|nr:hypothetical protein HMPREF1548_00134 [Clostridium sp. KLE 1755]